jgi:RHS repeat-associated protein
MGDDPLDRWDGRSIETATGDAPPDVADWQFSRGMTADAARLRKLGEERSSATAERERELSESRYADLTGAEAVAVDRVHAAPVVADPEPLVPGDVLRYFGDYAARVDPGPGADAMVVQSAMPLRTDTGEPTDLALEETVAGFGPEGALVPLWIGARATDGVWFESSGFGMVPVATGDRRGQVVGGAAVWPNALTDTDLAVRPTASGFETFAILRSAESPTAIEYQLHLPAGAHVETSAGGSGLRIVSGDREIATIDAPVAYDADDWPVAVSQTVVGDRLRLEVDIEGADPRFPVTVDPTVTNTYDWRAACGSTTFSGWVFGTTGNPYFSPFQGNAYLGCGNYIRDTVGHAYTANQNSWFRYSVPGNGTEAQITSFISNGYLDELASADMCVVWGIAKVGGWTAGPQTDCAGPGAKSINLSSTSGTAAYWQVWAHSSGTRTYTAYQGYARVGVTDSTEPQSTSAPAVGWTGDDAAAVTAAFSDGGVGIQSARLWAPASPAWTGGKTVAASSCVRIPCAATLSLAGTVANLPDGQNGISAQATDAAGNPRTVSTTVKVDRAAPRLSLSGDLYAGRGQDLDRASSPYQLNVAVDDTIDDTTPVSGVASLGVTVDGTPISPSSSPGGACGAAARTCEQIFNVNPYDFAPGAHTVTVTGRDSITGPVHTRTSSFTFNSVSGSLTSPTAGTVTGKRITLGARARQTGLDRAKFQYSTSSRCEDPATSPTWNDIPSQSVADARNEVGTWPVNIADGATPTLAWNVAQTLIDDRDFCVRAWFSSSTSGAAGPSQAVKVPLDRSAPGADRASAAIGPGAVDLVTGNFSYAAADVSVNTPVSNLSVSRTFNSRTAGDPAQSAGRPLGPGWRLDLPVPEAASEYQRLDVSALDLSSSSNAGYVTLTMSGGAKVAFRRDLADYVPDAGFEQLALSHEPAGASSVGAISSFQLTDAGGNQVTFTRSTGNEFVPSRVAQPAGSATATGYAFEVVAGVTRPLRQLAPAPEGLDCSNALASGTVPVGCRMLEFVYAPATTTPPAAGGSGDYPNRLKQIDLKAAAPSGAPVSFTMQTVTIQQYGYDPDGRLVAAWDPRISPALKETYTYESSGRLATIKPPGLNAWSMSYASASPDPSGGRLAAVSRATPIQDGSTQTATTSVVYNVPLSGANAPYTMDAASLDATGQTDIPRDATAIFPPDQLPSGSPPSDWTRATVHYLNADGREVNTATPGGHITTTEYDAHGNPIRELTAANRARALASGTTASAHAAKAAELDTHRTYLPNNVDVKEEWGPLHRVALETGGTALARRHTVNEYDYTSSPAPSDDYHLTTKSTVSALVGSNDVDTRITGYDYGGQSNLGWKLRKPTTVTTDPTGLNEKRVTLYDPSTGLETEARKPSNPAGGDASATQTLYYAAGSGTVPACGVAGDKSGWAGMICMTRPAAQPTGALPELPVSVYEYNQLGQQTKRRESFPTSTSTRTRTIDYDSAGRKTSEAVSSTAGSAVPTITHAYNLATGMLTTTSDGARTVSRAYDAIGRMISYTDGDGQATSTTYDLLSRPVVTTDGKGTQTRTYDASLDSRGQLSRLIDSQAGTFTATYDADGDIATQTYPNGVIACTVRDASGDPVELSYVKSTACSGADIWLRDTQASSIHGQRLSDEIAQLNRRREYRYDAAGRLTLTQDVRSGGCTSRQYAYDANSNRTRLWRRSSVTAACDTTSPVSPKTYSYDAADRATDAGMSYDDFGRTLTLPPDQAGSSATSISYYGDDLLASITQGSVTRSYTLDPQRRVRQSMEPNAPTQTHHYSDDSDNASWIATQPGGPGFTRNVLGIDGDLVAIVEAGAATIQLTDLHGDIVATADSNAGTTSLLDTRAFDEFGSPLSSNPGARYGWLGAKLRRTALPSGAIAMGVRLYVPQLGRFTSTDPIVGGSANAYDYALQDPVNNFDLDGMCVFGFPCPKFVKRVAKFAAPVTTVYCGWVSMKVGSKEWARSHSYWGAQRARAQRFWKCAAPPFMTGG